MEPFWGIGAVSNVHLAHDMREVQPNFDKKKPSNIQFTSWKGKAAARRRKQERSVRRQRIIVSFMESVLCWEALAKKSHWPLVGGKQLAYRRPGKPRLTG